MDGKKLIREELGQDEFGNDLERLRYNLSLTPKERLLQHNQALQSVLRIREAVRRSGYRKVS